MIKYTVDHDKKKKNTLLILRRRLAFPLRSWLPSVSGAQSPFSPAPDAGSLVLFGTHNVSKTPRLRAFEFRSVVERKRFPVLFLRKSPAAFKTLPFCWSTSADSRCSCASGPSVELGHLVPQNGGCVGQPRVVGLEHLHFLLQPRDAFQFALAAFGGRQSVPELLALCLDEFLALHVDGRHGWRAVAAVHVGNGLGAPLSKTRSAAGRRRSAGTRARFPGVGSAVRAVAGS